MKEKIIDLETTVNLYDYISYFTDEELIQELRKREFEREERKKRPKISKDKLSF